MKKLIHTLTALAIVASSLLIASNTASAMPTGSIDTIIYADIDNHCSGSSSITVKSVNNLPPVPGNERWARAELAMVDSTGLTVLLAPGPSPTHVDQFFPGDSFTHVFYPPPGDLYMVAAFFVYSSPSATDGLTIPAEMFEHFGITCGDDDGDDGGDTTDGGDDGGDTTDGGDDGGDTTDDGDDGGDTTEDGETTETHSGEVKESEVDEAVVGSPLFTG
jgi:hypothetical protein